MGLTVPLFFSYIGIVVICAITLFSHISVKKFIVIVVLLALVYLVLFLAGKLNFGKLLFSEKFPDVVINDNF